MADVKVPEYTLGEEIANSVTHGIGAVFGIVALVLTVIFSAKNRNVMGIISSSIYGTTMILMFLISCIYHALSPKLKAKKVFRIIDHCDIYIFIAGCYTPYCLSLLKNRQGWWLLFCVWRFAIIGVILNAINLEKYNVISFVLYILIGWMALLSIKAFYTRLTFNGFLLLLSGGIAYTVGAVFYVIGAKVKYIHSVFHIFVLAGAVLQFFSILLYVV